MDGNDISDLVYQLRWKLKDTSYLDNDREVERHLSYIDDELFSGKKFSNCDKNEVRWVKENVYGIESVLREIIEPGGEDQHPKSTVESFRSSIATEFMPLFKELTPYVKRPYRLGPYNLGRIGKRFNYFKEQFIKLVMDSKSAPVISILGKPGTGKSTLLTHALADPRLQNYFSSATDIVVDDSFMRRHPHDGYDGESIRKKCLRVIDDMEDVILLNLITSSRWRKDLFDRFFKAMAKGSKIVMASHPQLDLELQLESMNVPVLRLPSLEQDESWNLFQKIAFKDQGAVQPTLLAVGHKICQLCGNNPGVINIVASIMSSKSTTEEWDHLFTDLMTCVPDPLNTISSTYQLANLFGRYDQKGLRHRFAWCSLLPKDHRFHKDQIFNLWRAIEDFSPRETTREIPAVDVHFNEFLEKGYIVKDGTTGSIVSYKISYLVSELMKYVARDEFCLVENPTTKLNHKIIRHVSFIVDPTWEPPLWLAKAKQLQSILLWPRNSGGFKSLSIAELNMLGMKTNLGLLHGEAVHFELLPLLLVKFKRLGNLRLDAVSSFSHPQDIPALHELLNCFPRYKSENKYALYEGDNLTDGILKQEGGLSLLVKFNGLSKLTIQHEKFNERNLLYPGKKFVGFLHFQSTSLNVDDAELTFLDPRQNVESLKIWQWKEEMLPAWAIEELPSFLSNLFSIQIANCSKLRHLPGFNKLPHLKSLQLGGMSSLVEITISGDNSASANVFYPSLKCLVLYDLPKLKGWSNEADDILDIQERYYFPLLTQVKVMACPELNLIPSMPVLESLQALNVDAGIVKHLLRLSVIAPSLSRDIQECGGIESVLGTGPNAVDKVDWHSCRSIRSLKLSNTPALGSLSSDAECIVMLEQLSFYWLTDLKIIPEWIGQLTQLRRLSIHYCMKLTMLPNSLGDFSALEELDIRYCPRLSEFPKSLPNLKKLRVQEFGRLEPILAASKILQELEINNCDELVWETPSVEGDISVNIWEGLTSLRSLKLTNIDPFPKGLDFAKISTLHRLVIEKCRKLTSLPESLCSLSALEYLTIHCCPGLTNLPARFTNLESLKRFGISVSPKLQKRCQEPDGEDRHLIQHISTVVLGNSSQ